MPFIDLETAVDHILRACNASHKKGRSPFFFLVGGGISFPPIPLASEIVEHCKDKVAKECTRTTEPPGKQPERIDIYSHWFDQAYPQPSDRQEYLRELIEGKPVSHANLYLAHLLLEKTITNLVVTPNFDDFLSRALTLFGKPHIVCDHPGTVGRIHPDHDDIQIIHVHGTYWFYDCCNLLGEINERSQSSAQTSSTMASLLERILWDRSPLVIGYGGWEGDVIMTALKRRLQSPLGHNIYWFCYQQAAVDSLPDWLKSNPQVYFVVPSPEEPRSAKKQNEPYLSAETKEFSGKERDQTALPAHLVLDKLIQKFSLESPELTRDPLGFFAEHLSLSLLQDNQDKVEDIYYIRSVIDGIKKAKKIYAEKITEIESQLESVRDAMRRSQYREAIELANKIEKNNMELKQLRGLMEAMWLAALGLSDNSKEELKGYDLVIVIGDILLGQNKDEAALRELVARALVKKGVRLGRLNQCQEEIAVYDEVVRRFGEAAEPALRKLVARALFNKGVSLGSLNQDKEAIAVYDEVVKRFGEATEPALREQAARALVNKGFSLGRLKQGKEAIAVYDEVVRRFGEATEPVLRERVANALVSKGFRLGRLKQDKEEIAVYDDVVKRFGEAAEPALREMVANALYNKGVSLGRLKQDKEAIAVYDEVVRRFGEATEPVLRERVANALVNKGFRLGRLKQGKETIAVYDEVVRRFGEATEPALREQVANALFNKGILLLRQEKNAQACQCFSEAIGFWEVNQGIEGQLHKIAALSGLQQFDEAEHLLKQLIEKSAIAPRTAKYFLSDLELIASAPQPPEGIQEFLARVREILGLK